MTPLDWLFVLMVWSTKVMPDGAVLGPVRAEISATTQDRCEHFRNLIRGAVRGEDATITECERRP